MNRRTLFILIGQQSFFMSRICIAIGHFTSTSTHFISQVLV